jgi:hypothetical protein
MVKVIDIEPRRIRREHERKDARANALKESFSKAREELKTSAENKQQSTDKLLALFKARPPRKPSPPTRRK